MAEADKIGSSKKAFCATCADIRNCEIKGFDGSTESVAGGQIIFYENWYLLKCRGCDYTFVQKETGNSEDYVAYRDEYGEEYVDYNETVETWPARAKREVPKWFENGTVDTGDKDVTALNAALSEMYGALKEDLLVLASIGLRTVLDISAEHFGAEANSTFREKIEFLTTKHQLTPADAEKLEILIDAGSAAAHRGWKPDQKQMKTLVDTLEEFIYGAFVLPAKRRAKEVELAKIKAQIPKRRQ